MWKWPRLVALLVGCVGLFLVYLFQDYLDFYSIITLSSPTKLNYTMAATNVETVPFIINKLLRYVLNDLFAICIIYALFEEKKYTRFAFYVMFFGMIVLLPMYIFIFLSHPEGFSSMLSHLHRIVMNPVLMMLLIPAFFYQRRMTIEE